MSFAWWRPLSSRACSNSYDSSAAAASGGGGTAWEGARGGGGRAVSVGGAAGGGEAQGSIALGDKNAIRNLTLLAKVASRDDEG